MLIDNETYIIVEGRRKILGEIRGPRCSRLDNPPDKTDMSKQPELHTPTSDLHLKLSVLRMVREGGSLVKSDDLQDLRRVKAYG